MPSVTIRTDTRLNRNSKGRRDRLLCSALGYVPMNGRYTSPFMQTAASLGLVYSTCGYDHLPLVGVLLMRVLGY